MHITTFIILIPIIVGMRRFSKLELETKWLLYMLIPVAVIQFFSVWWSSFIMKNNLPFYYFYILVEIIFIAKIYYLYLKESKFRLFVPIATSFFTVLFILKITSDLDSIWNYSTHLRAAEGIIVLIFAGTYFAHEYKKQEIMYLQKAAGFWISGGFILFFLCNLLLFGFSELVYAQEKSIFQSIWVIHAILTILLYLSFTIAFLCKKKVTTF